MRKRRRLLDEYRFPGYRPRAEVRGVFGDPRARVIRLERVQKKRLVVIVVQSTGAITTRRHVGYGTGPGVIGIDEIALRKGHRYRIVVSDLERGRPIWYGGEDRSEESLDWFYQWFGGKKAKKIRLAVMDMWKAFEKSTQKNVPQAAILFDKFHVMRHLGEVLDNERKMEYARLSGRDRSYIKGQKYTLLSNKENRRRALKKLLKANKRLPSGW